VDSTTTLTGLLRNAPITGNGTLVWFIFDDGIDGERLEHQHRATILDRETSPGSPQRPGVIQMVNIPVLTNEAAGNDQLTVDFFDASHT